MAGWLAHWVESIEDADSKIWRPRQVYTGEGKRGYVPLDHRYDHQVQLKSCFIFSESARLANQPLNEYIRTTADHHPFSKRTRAAAWSNKPAPSPTGSDSKAKL